MDYTILLKILGVLSFVPGLSYVIKGITSKNVGWLGAAVARFYLTWAIFGPFLKMEHTLLGIIIVMISDLVSNSIYWVTGKFRKQIEYGKLVGTVNSLLGKLQTILESPYIGYFITTTDGLIEFSSPKMNRILEVNNAVGLNIFDYLSRDMKNKIENNDEIHCKTLLKTYNSYFIPVRISVSKTINGHPTLTGSIIEERTCDS